MARADKSSPWDYEDFYFSHTSCNDQTKTIFIYKLYLLLATHFPIELDVTNSESINHVLEEVINKYKRPPSLIVNSAGITRDSFILKMDESDFDCAPTKVRYSFTDMSG